MSNPIDSPDLFDLYTLDGRRSPGITKITSGGERALNWTKQQGMLTVGASTILRYEEIATVTYQHTLWDVAQFPEWDEWAQFLNSAVDVRPPKAWVLGDERLKHCRIAAVALEKLGPQMVGGRGGPWTHTVQFTAYKKPKPLGGAVQAPQTEVERDILRLNAENKALNDQNDAARKAARKGK